MAYRRVGVSACRRVGVLACRRIGEHRKPVVQDGLETYGLIQAGSLCYFNQ
jgi:hypothetical protein